MGANQCSCLVNLWIGHDGIAGLTQEHKHMTSVWSYPTSVDLADRRLVGYDVEATDGHIGKIDEASNAAGRAHMVVDTGFWIFGKKRLIPAGVVQSIDDEDEKVHIALTKDQVKAAPDFDADLRDDRDDYDTYDTYYAPFGR